MKAKDKCCYCHRDLTFSLKEGGCLCCKDHSEVKWWGSNKIYTPEQLDELMIDVGIYAQMCYKVDHYDY